MGGDGEVLLARQLTMLLTNRGQFELLGDAYCRVRNHLSPTAALDRALAELLPSSQHEAVTAFIAREGEDAHSGGGLPPVHHSLIDGLEDLYELRQSSERRQRRERMDVADLAADLAADAHLATAYREGREEAGGWLERFPSMVRERASASPTPTGRRRWVDQALEALVATGSDDQARGDDEAEAQVAWCMALRDRLLAGSGESVDVQTDRPMEARSGDGLDDDIGTTAARPHETTPPLQTVDVLRSAPLPLGDEDSFTALIEAANGHDDHFDPTDERTVEAMESLLEKEVLRSGESPRAAVDARARNELWTHMAWGYRVGRYVLTTHGRTPSSPDPRPASYVASDLVSYVSQAHQRQEVVDLLTSAELNAALHYHPLSSTLCRACGGDKARARAWVRLVEDLGFLTALGAEDVTRGPRGQIDETRPQVVAASAGDPRRRSRVTDTDHRVEAGREA